MSLDLHATPTKRVVAPKIRRRPTVAQAGPHMVDVHVGQRLRLGRLMAGKTQEEVAADLKLSFQQVQKYERGVNRVSCSMLTEFARSIGKPVIWFFEEAECSAPTSVEAEAAAIIDDRQRLTLELVASFGRLKSEKLKMLIVGLIRALGE